MATEMERILEAVKSYGGHSEELAELGRDIQAGHDAVDESFRSDLKTKVSQVLKARTKLEIRIQGSPELFNKPRTKTVDGVKFGIKKGKGTLVLPKDKLLLKRLADKYPDAFKALPRDPKVPGKSYFAAWKVEDVKSLGIKILDPDDSVTIGLVQSDTEALIELLLKAHTQDKG